MSAPWHTWVDHAAEVQLQVGADSFAGLLAEAGRALGALLLRGRAAEPSGEPRTIELSSVDRAALLVDWLNEIIFLAEVERWNAVDVNALEAAEPHLKVSARGVDVDEPPATV